MRSSDVSVVYFGVPRCLGFLVGVGAAGFWAVVASGSFSCLLIAVQGLIFPVHDSSRGRARLPRGRERLGVLLAAVSLPRGLLWNACARQMSQMSASVCLNCSAVCWVEGGWLVVVGSQ